MFRQLVFLLALALLAWPQSAWAQEPIWHYSPYQIRVWLATAPAPELNQAVEERILRALHERSEAVALAPWTVTAERAPAPIHGAMLAGLEWMTVGLLAPGEKEEDEGPSSASSDVSTASLSTGASSIPSDAGAELAPPLNGGTPEVSPSPPPDYSDLLEQNDKLLLLHIAPDRGGFLIEARELDCRTRQWSDVVERRAGYVSMLPLEAFRAMEAVFRPVARIEKVRGKEAAVRLRAGGLVDSEQSPAHLPDNSVLLPVVRFNDRYGKPRENGIQIAPWSFLLFQERQPAGRVECELVAGVASPLGARSSSRIEKYGLLVRPRYDKTDMIVLAQPVTRDEQDQKQPLGGYEIHERLPGAEELEFIGRTDWRGLVEIPKVDRPLRVLYVKNGGRILSKFPIVPGREPRIEVRVMNDDRRLEAEGFVRGMQSRIMDLVIAREVLALRIRKRIEAKKFDEAAALMNELRTMPTRDQIQTELDQEAARQRLLPADRRTKAQIENLFTETRAMIAKYLDPTLADRLNQELLKANPGT